MKHLVPIKERQIRVSEGMRLAWKRRKELEQTLENLRRFEEHSKSVRILCK